MRHSMVKSQTVARSNLRRGKLGLSAFAWKLLIPTSFAIAMGLTPEMAAVYGFDHYDETLNLSYSLLRDGTAVGGFVRAAYAWIYSDMSSVGVIACWNVAGFTYDDHPPQGLGVWPPDMGFYALQLALGGYGWGAWSALRQDSGAPPEGIINWTPRKVNGVLSANTLLKMEALTWE
jgi:hypothetical protein